jgi:hypothetical protein
MNCVTDNEDEVFLPSSEDKKDKEHVTWVLSNPEYSSFEDIHESQLNQLFVESFCWRSSGTFDSSCTNSQFEEWRHQISQEVSTIE